MNFLLAVILGGFGRRFFGGLFDGHKYEKILDNRGLHTLYLLSLMFAILFPYGDETWQKITLLTVVVVWLQVQFWSRGHHPIFSADKPVEQFNEIDWERYTDRWYNKVCLRVFPTSMHYGYMYSWVWVMLRYTCPMIPMMYFDWRFIIIGALVAPIYLICDQMAKSDMKIFGQTDSELAEYIVGGLFFGGIYLLRDTIWQISLFL